MGKAYAYCRITRLACQLRGEAMNDPQEVLPFPTDTCVPVPQIPIFYMHEGEHPWCLNPSCICHKNDAQLKNLLLSIISRKLKLLQIVNGKMS